ncbi:MAG TPA: hypothetical protein VF636_03555 [Sphingomonas sp.]|jgi:hypothetical protein
MRAVAILSCAALAACGSNEPSAPTVAEKEAAQIAAVKTLSGWDRVFASPLETVGQINQAGFGLPDYASSRSGGAYLAQGVDRLMSRSAAPSPNMGSASVSGSAPDRLDQISFVLKLNDAEDAATARDRFASVVGDFFRNAKLSGGDPVLAAVRAGRSARPNVSGLKANVTATANRIDVTFLRPAASAAPANS